MVSAFSHITEYESCDLFIENAKSRLDYMRHKSCKYLPFFPQRGFERKMYIFFLARVLKRIIAFPSNDSWYLFVKNFKTFLLYCPFFYHFRDVIYTLSEYHYTHYTPVDLFGVSSDYSTETFKRNLFWFKRSNNWRPANCQRITRYNISTRVNETAIQLTFYSHLFAHFKTLHFFFLVSLFS